MSQRDKAIEELKKLIREQRARIDPAVLALAQKAAAQKTALPEKTFSGKAVPDKVAYDRAAAEKAVRLFLATHKDPKGFEKRLLELLKKSTH